ncbi:hypothetical protein C493_05575 [Natronolimnohabitans innermongolicus JCM 12255]|uniref:Uncharacterized protein n=1 Tax=Natronolimnohabitans innermongolicus JCM 12255 TaxID=1227499 RepID=L9XBJ6_9EURY|nr:hypothetical protein C493_05575 [Natronolimnohabitans innermongolicus JCM 12255]
MFQFLGSKAIERHVLLDRELGDAATAVALEYQLRPVDENGELPCLLAVFGGSLRQGLPALTTF